MLFFSGFSAQLFLMLPFVELKYSFVVVCSTATCSAIQEGYYTGIGREII
jgi:hypothetical protein